MTKRQSENKPIWSMYGIFTYIWVSFRANVGKYSIHGAFGKQQHMANTLRHYVRYFVGKACHDSGSGYTSNMLLNMIEYDPSGLRCWYSCWSATPFARTPEASGVLWEMFPERDPAVIGCLAGGFPQRFLPLHHKHQQHAREADSTWHADGHMIRVKVCEGCITGCHLLTTYKGEFPC